MAADVVTAIAKLYRREMSVPDTFFYDATPSEISGMTVHVIEQHPEMNTVDAKARAIARLAAIAYLKEQAFLKTRKTEKPSPLASPYFWLNAAAVVIIIILLSLHAHAQLDGIQIQNGSGTPVKNWMGGIAKLKCSTNLTCTLSGGVVTIVASGAGGSPTEIQVNGSDTTAQTPANFQTGTNLTVSNPSAGNVKFDLSGVIPATLGGLGNAGAGNNGQVPISDGTKFVPGDPIVSGPAAEGASPVNNPVWVAGKGADNLIHSIRMANDGTVRVDPTGTTVQPVSGTVTTTPPANASTNLTQVNSVALGSPSNYGTSPGAVSVAGVNAFITNIPHAIIDSGSTTAVTGNVTAVQATGTNLHAVLDTTSTTAVTQATGTNLHAVIDSGSTTAVTGNVTAVQATGTNLHAVLDTTSTTAVTQATGTNLHAVLDTTSTTAVTQATAANLNANVSQATGTNLHAVLDTTSTTAVTQATGTNLHAVIDSGSTTAVTGTVASNVTQFGGTNVSTGTGAAGAGIPRVTISNDSSLAANQSVNTAQFGGSNVVTGTGTGGAGIPRVTVSSDSSTAVTGATTPADAAAPTTAILANDFPEAFNGSTWDRQRSAGVGNNVAATGLLAEASYGQFNATPPSLADTKYAATQMDSNGRTLVAAPSVEYSLNRLVALASTPGKATGVVRGSFGRPVTSTGDALDVNVKYPPAAADPCSGPNKTNVPISLTANNKLVSGTSAPIRICSIFLLSTSAETFSVVEGTGATCATGIAAVIGSTTAANGPSAAANGGYSQGNGAAWVASAKTAGNDVCILISGATLIAGNLTYAF